MKRLIEIVLLLSLFVNVSHAYFIASEERCSHEMVTEYVMEADHGSQCGDLCDSHHMFHLQAIPVSSTVAIPTFSNVVAIPTRDHHYLSPLNEPSYRPPIV